MARLLLLDLVLQKLRFDLEVGELLAQALGFDAHVLSFLFSVLDLLLHHDATFDRLVKFGFDVLKGGRGVARLPFVIIIGDLDVPELELKPSIRLPQCSDLLLKGALLCAGLGLGLSVLALR